MEDSASWTTSDKEDNEDFKVPYKKVKVGKSNGNSKSNATKTSEATTALKPKKHPQLAKKTPAETAEEKKARRLEYRRAKYQNMDPDKKAALLEKRRQTARVRYQILKSVRATETTEDAEKRKAKKNEAEKKRREKLTPEKRKKMNEYARNYQRQKRQDPEFLMKIRAQDLRRKWTKRESETPEQCAARKAKEKEYNQRRLAQETPDQRIKRLTRVNTRRRQKLAEMTPDELHQFRLQQRAYTNLREKNIPKEVKQERNRRRGKRIYEAYKKRKHLYLTEERKKRMKEYQKKWRKHMTLTAERKKRLKEYQKKWRDKLSSQARQKLYDRVNFLNRWRIRSKSKRLSSATEVYNQKLSDEQRQEIERGTRKGNTSFKWHDVRNFRITGGMVTRVTKRKYKDPWDLASALKTPRRKRNIYIFPCIRGELLEPVGVERYIAAKSIQAKNIQYPVGFIIHPVMNYVGATPDCLITEEDGNGNQILGVVEIKSPMSCVEDIAKRDGGGKFVQCTKSKNCGNFLVGPIKPTSKKFQLITKHRYFEQVCLQLMSTGREFGDFVVFYQNDEKPEEFELWVQRIWTRDYEAYMMEMGKKMKQFYENYMIKPQPANLLSVRSRYNPKNALFKSTTTSTRITDTTSKTMFKSSCSQSQESRTALSSGSNLQNLSGRPVRKVRQEAKATIAVSTSIANTDDDLNADDGALLLKENDPEYDCAIDDDESNSSSQDDDMDNDFSRIR